MMLIVLKCLVIVNRFQGTDSDLCAAPFRSPTTIRKEKMSEEMTDVVLGGRDKSVYDR